MGVFFCSQSTVRGGVQGYFMEFGIMGAPH